MVEPWRAIVALDMRDSERVENTCTPPRGDSRKLTQSVKVAGILFNGSRKDISAKGVVGEWAMRRGGKGILLETRYERAGQKK